MCDTPHLQKKSQKNISPASELNWTFSRWGSRRVQQQHYPRPPLLPKIGLLSPQSSALHCLLIIPLLTLLRSPTIHIQPLLVQVVEQCNGRKTSVDCTIGKHQRRPGGNGHRGSQVCPLAFPPLSHPVQKGQMSLNCFNPAAMGQLFQTAASLQLLALVL